MDEQHDEGGGTGAAAGAMATGAAPPLRGAPQGDATPPTTEAVAALPRSTAGAPAAGSIRGGAPTAPRDSVGALRILLIDDDDVDRMAVRRTLAQTRLDAELTDMADAAMALQALLEQRYDCVLLDFRMPRLDGMAVLKRMQALGIDAPVIMLTGQGDEALAVALMKAGAADYIGKNALSARRLEQGILTAIKLHAAERATREAQEALRRQVELSQLFVGIVSHDLRNPLNVIMLNAALLERMTPSLPEPAAASVARIRTSGQRAIRLIRDLLDVTQARMGSGIPVVPAAIDLHATVQQAVEDVRQGHPQRDIALLLEGDGAGIFDPDRILQMVTNLLVNALVHGASERAVSVRVGGSADMVTVAVHNHGEPIPEDMRETLFEPLRRGSAKRDGQGGNIGLGLFIVQQIARAHGGVVDVRSSPDDGTTFTVRLPRHGT